MIKTKINIDLREYPEELRAWLSGADVYDSSCSRAARVIFIDRDGGYFLKSAERGALKREAELTEFFNRKGLGVRVLGYFSCERDLMLTESAAGEDCTHYTDRPEFLCDLTAELLRELHSTDASDCPVDRTREYLSAAENNYKRGNYDASLFPDNWGYSSADEAWAVLRDGARLLRSDTLIHGDYCLPNIILDRGRFSKFIDLGNGGLGDRHIDLFWGAWSLFFNLKTDRYRERFFDAYGRDRVDPDMLRIVAAAEVFG